MIKWQQYAALTRDKQIEYTFRFKGRKLTPPYSLNSVIILGLLFPTTLLPLIILFRTDIFMVDYELDARQYIQTIYTLMRYYMFGVIVSLVVYLIRVLWAFVTEYIWIKKNCVVVKKWTK